ncbi:MAG: hypothetical protein GXP53_04635 [Deltaproteobacteria bacterium]|nr:hypothetical protein [Deltaproteobacteria bacterium]
MAKHFRPGNTGESRLISRIESSKEFERRKALSALADAIDSIGNAISNKLVENQIVETNHKNTVEEQIVFCLEKLNRADDFDIDFQIAPFRQIIANPHVISLYVTAFVLEQLIKHKDVVDIFGSDEEIYNCIHKEVSRHLNL